MVNPIQGQHEELEPQHPALYLRSILRTVWKRKVELVSAWLLFAAAGIAVVRWLPSVFFAEAVILIDTQKIPEKFVPAAVASGTEDRIAAIRQTLLSGRELQRIIDYLDLYREERKTHPEEEILDRMRKDIHITLETAGAGANNKRTVAVRVGYQGSDPDRVMRAANRLADLAVEQNLKAREGEAEETSQFLDTQLGEAKEQLNQLEAAVSAYKLKHNGELPQQEPLLGSALSRLQTELEANRDSINRAQQTRIILDGNLQAMEATLTAQTRGWEQSLHPLDGNSPAAQAAAPGPKKASDGLQEQLAVLRGRYSDEHPDVVRLLADIEKVKRLEEQRQAAGPAVIASAAPPREPAEFARTRQQIAELQARMKSSDQELEDRKADQLRILRDLKVNQQRLERLPVHEQEMALISRDYEMSKANYKSLLDKKTAAEMALEMERREQSERFTIVDRARIPKEPIKPRRPQLYLGSAVVGLMLALLAGFGAELRHNVILGEWELPAGTNVLARLPAIQIPQRP